MRVFALAGALLDELVVGGIAVATVHAVGVDATQLRMRQVETQRGGERAEALRIEAARGRGRKGGAWVGRRRLLSVQSQCFRCLLEAEAHRRIRVGIGKAEARRCTGLCWGIKAKRRLGTGVGHAEAGRHVSIGAPLKANARRPTSLGFGKAEATALAMAGIRVVVVVCLLVLPCVLLLGLFLLWCAPLLWILVLVPMPLVFSFTLSSL